MRLRIINGATATAFYLDLGQLPGTIVALDGTPCEPLPYRRIPIAQGQRVDVIAQIPPEGGAFPVLAQVEADRTRTGIVLATSGATVARVADQEASAAPHSNLSLDAVARAAAPPKDMRANRSFHMMLGEEPGYRWTINGAMHAEAAPLRARIGDRVEFMFMNPTGMMHPMHLHGHHFQVVGIGARRVSGPMRDTVIVPPHLPVTVAVAFDKPGSWRLHCHHLYHMAAGMMTDVVVTQ